MFSRKHSQSFHFSIKNDCANGILCHYIHIYIYTYIYSSLFYQLSLHYSAYDTRIIFYCNMHALYVFIYPDAMCRRSSIVINSLTRKFKEHLKWGNLILTFQGIEDINSLSFPKKIKNIFKQKLQI